MKSKWELMLAKAKYRKILKKSLEKATLDELYITLEEVRKEIKRRR